MSKQPLAGDFFKEVIRVAGYSRWALPIPDPIAFGDDCPTANPFPNPVLAIKSEFAQQARFVDSSSENQNLEINVTLVNYKVTFFVNKKLIRETYWEHVKNISLEELNGPGIQKTLVGLKELTAKLDVPNIPNLHECYKCYLEGKLFKRNSTPIADRIRLVGNAPGDEATRQALIERLRANYTSLDLNRRPIDNIFNHSGADIIITLMLGSRGIGPSEVCFTNSFLKKAKYRLFIPLKREERLAAILYHAKSIPKGLNRVAIKSWKTALGKLTAIGRKERFTKNIATCIRFFAKSAKPKSGILKLKLKLLKHRIWQVKFEKRLKMLLRITWSIRMRASAEPRPSTEPPEPPMSQVYAHVQSLKENTDREIQEILHRLTNLNDDFMLSTKENKTIEDGLKINSEAIDEVRQEMLAFALESKEELLELKKQIHSSQSQLGDIRQSKPELETVLANFAEERQKLNKMAQEAITLANEESKKRIEVHKSELWAQMQKMPAEFKKQSEAFYAECKSLKAELKDIHEAYIALGTEQLKYDISSHTRAMSNFSKGIPDLEMRMGEIERTLSSQAGVMIEARNMLGDLRSVTKSTAAKLAREKGLEEDRRKIEVDKLRRQGKSINVAKRIAAKENLNRAKNTVTVLEDEIKVEVSNAVPKIAGFVREWNSLKKGDLFKFAGKILTIDDTFNPSIRVKECGQETLKWEAQKFANGLWYSRGYL